MTNPPPIDFDGRHARDIRRVHGMRIQRPLAALLTALALAGGSGALTACNSPQGSKTGTPVDKVPLSSQNPGDPSQGNLPTGSNQSGSSGAGRAGGNGKGQP
jgi:hypothetical protein